MREEYLLAIDPSTTKTGWALFRGEILFDWGTFDAAEGENIFNIGMRMNKIAKLTLQMAHEVDIIISPISSEFNLNIILENELLRTNPSISRKLSIGTGTILGTLVTFFEDHVKEVKIISPNAWWQVMVKHTTHDKVRYQRSDRKRISKEFVMSYFEGELSKDELTDDEADAINIGRFGRYAIDTSEKNAETKNKRVMKRRADKRILVLKTLINKLETEGMKREYKGMKTFLPPLEQKRLDKYRKELKEIDE